MSLQSFVTRAVVFGNTNLGGQTTFTGNSQEAYSEDLLAGANPTVPFSFIGDDAQVIAFIASVEMTINPDAGPTISLEAGVLYQWCNDSGLTNPFAGVTVTEFVVTNVLAGTLQLFVQSSV